VNGMLGRIGEQLRVDREPAAEPPGE